MQSLADYLLSSYCVPETEDSVMKLTSALWALTVCRGRGVHPAPSRRNVQFHPQRRAPVGRARACARAQPGSDRGLGDSGAAVLAEPAAPRRARPREQPVLAQTAADPDSGMRGRTRGIPPVVPETNCSFSEGNRKGISRSAAWQLSPR